MNFANINLPENKIFQISKLLKDTTKIRGIVLRFDRKNRISVCFPESTPRFMIEEIKVVLRTNFPNDNFVFRAYRKTIS